MTRKPRPTISPKDKVTVAIAQARDGHIICPLCGFPLYPDHPRILEHMIVRAWTNSDDPGMLAWVHKACADLKTYGRKATCADGDIHKIAKAKRVHAKHFGQGAEAKPKRRLSQGRQLRGRVNPWPKCDRKIPNRPFPKRRQPEVKI